MAAQVNPFPKYEIPQRTLITSDAKTILNEWKTYLERIKYTASSNFEFIEKIIQNLQNMIDFYNIHKFKIPDAYINYIDNSLNKLHIENNSDKIHYILSNILEHSSSLCNVVYLYNISSVNTGIAYMLKSTKDNLQASIDISTLSNLTGLAAEFDLQYKKYNKERIFWLMITLSLLAIINSKLFEFIMISSTLWGFLMYLFLIVSIILYLNDTLIDDLIEAFNELMNNTNPSGQNSKNTDVKLKSSKYTNPTQYISTFISFCIFIGLYLTDKLSCLKLFNVNLIENKFSTWQDFIPYLSIYIPMIWLLWFAIKQYHYTTKIMNAYRFKMALSLAYHGYKKECEELFKISKNSQLLQNSEQENKTLKDKEHEYKEYLLKEVLQVISDDPTKRDFKDTHMPWSEIKDVVRIFKNSKQ